MPQPRQDRLELPGLVELTPQALQATNGGRGSRGAARPLAPAKPAGFFQSLLRPWR